MFRTEPQGFSSGNLLKSFKDRQTYWYGFDDDGTGIIERIDDRINRQREILLQESKKCQKLKVLRRGHIDVYNTVRSQVTGYQQASKKCDVLSKGLRSIEKNLANVLSNSLANLSPLSCKRIHQFRRAAKAAARGKTDKALRILSSDPTDVVNPFISAEKRHAYNADLDRMKKIITQQADQRDQIKKDLKLANKQIAGKIAEIIYNKNSRAHLEELIGDPEYHNDGAIAFMRDCMESGLSRRQIAARVKKNLKLDPQWRLDLSAFQQSSSKKRHMHADEFAQVRAAKQATEDRLEVLRDLRSKAAATASFELKAKGSAYGVRNVSDILANNPGDRQIRTADRVKRRWGKNDEVFARLGNIIRDENFNAHQAAKEGRLIIDHADPANMAVSVKDAIAPYAEDAALWTGKKMKKCFEQAGAAGRLCRDTLNKIRYGAPPTATQEM